MSLKEIPILIVKLNHLLKKGVKDSKQITIDIVTGENKNNFANHFTPFEISANNLFQEEVTQLIQIINKLSVKYGLRVGKPYLTLSDNSRVANIKIEEFDKK